jgi:hypothetical protein
MANATKEYITLDEFSKLCGISCNTIKRKYKEIPGIEKVETEYRVQKGTRYPCSIRRYKIPDSSAKRYVLLKSISENKYISAVDLQLYDKSFSIMLDELKNCNLIYENNNGNTYGANAYDCSNLGDKILQKRKKQAIQDIAERVAAVAGSFSGAAARELLNIG